MAEESEIDSTITELLATWDEAAAQALWDSLLTSGEETVEATNGVLPAAASPPPATPRARDHRPVPAGKRLPLASEGQRRPVPRVGTRVERSGRANERKLLALACQPPPLPHRRRPAIIRPAVWALEGRGRTTRKKETGDDSAAPGTDRRQEDAGEKQETGDDSAAPGRHRDTADSGQLTTTRQSDQDNPAINTNTDQRQHGNGTNGPRGKGPTVRSVRKLPPGYRVHVRGKAADTTPPTGTTEAEGTTRPGAEMTIPNPSVRRTRPREAMRVPIPGDRVIEVPYHVVHRSRKFRKHLEDGLWVIRFDTNGALRSIHRR